MVCCKHTLCSTEVTQFCVMNATSWLGAPSLKSVQGPHCGVRLSLSTMQPDATYRHGDSWCSLNVFVLCVNCQVLAFPNLSTCAPTQCVHYPFTGACGRGQGDELSRLILAHKFYSMECRMIALTVRKRHFEVYVYIGIYICIGAAVQAHYANPSPLINQT